MSASGLKNQIACSSNHWNQSTTFSPDQLKRSTPGNETQQDNELELCMQLWQLKWSNYHPMPKQCYLNILYFTHQPMISHDLDLTLHVIHKADTCPWAGLSWQTDGAPVQSKKVKLKGYQNNANYPCNKLCCIFTMKMKEKIKVKYLIIPPLSGHQESASHISLVLEFICKVFLSVCYCISFLFFCFFLMY